MEISLVILSLLFIKHFFIDFPFQTQDEINSKGNYGEFDGFMHSYKHGFATTFVFMLFTPWAVALGIIDTITHYHIDWLKMRYGNQDTTNKKFWTHLGLDQLAHNLVYIGLTVIYLCLL